MTIPISIGNLPPLLWIIIALLAIAAGLLVVDQIQRFRQTSTIEKCTFGAGAIAVLLFVAALFLRPQQQAEPESPDLQAGMDILNRGLMAFKVRFGAYPPSHIVLYEQPDGWLDDARSQSIIKRIWPQFDFAQSRDVNLDGDTEDRIELTGAECLVFFLQNYCVFFKY